MTTIQTTNCCQLLVILLFAENDTTLALSTRTQSSTSLGTVDLTTAKTTGMVAEASSAFILFNSD